MEKKLSILKGLHPGIVLGEELKKRSLLRGPFAISINEFPQTIGAIIKGKRGMNTSLALKIEQALGIEEGFFMTLQIFYEIKKEKQKLQNIHKPDLSKLRPVLFWDTTFDKINWLQHKRAVIERVFERGDQEEKNEITSFYGKDVVDEILKKKRA